MKLTNYTLWMAALAFTLAGCATPATTRVYTLANPAKASATALSTASPIAIEVLPVNVPERLKRPQMVLSTQGSTQLKILEQDRWSSSFNDELRDAMASGIARQLGAADVSRGGRVAGQPVYRIAVALREFDALPGDRVLAGFGWTVTRLASTARPGVERTIVETAMSCQSTLVKPVGNDTDSVVKGIQAAVADVVAAISASINALNTSGTARSETVDGRTGECTI